MKSISMFLAGLAVPVLVGCGGAIGGNQGFSQVRAISAVSSPSAIDVFSDFNVIGVGLGNGTGSGYSSHPSSLLNLGMRQTGTTQTLLTGTLNASLNESYTVIPHQTGANSWAMIALLDNASTPIVGKFKLRFVHVERFEGDVDLYFVDPGADLSLETPIVSDLSFQDVTGYIQLDSGDPKELRVTRANTLTQIGNTISFTPPSAAIRTLMLFDDGGTSLEVYND